MVNMAHVVTVDLNPAAIINGKQEPTALTLTTDQTDVDGDPIVMVWRGRPAVIIFEAITRLVEAPVRQHATTVDL